MPEFFMAGTSGLKHSQLLILTIIRASVQLRNFITGHCLVGSANILPRALQEPTGQAATSLCQLK